MKLLTLAIGVVFIIWSMRNKGHGIKLAKYTGYFIVIIALSGFLFNGIYMVKYWKKGYHHYPQCPCSSAKMPWNKNNPRMNKTR